MCLLLSWQYMGSTKTNVDLSRQFPDSNSRLKRDRFPKHPAGAKIKPAALPQVYGLATFLGTLVAGYGLIFYTEVESEAHE